MLLPDQGNGYDEPKAIILRQTKILSDSLVLGKLQIRVPSPLKLIRDGHHSSHPVFELGLSNWKERIDAAVSASSGVMRIIE